MATLAVRKKPTWQFYNIYIILDMGSDVKKIPPRQAKRISLKRDKNYIRAYLCFV